jgi:hypothetical protein
MGNIHNPHELVDMVVVASDVVDPDMCERCEDHRAVTYLDDVLVCGTCYVEGQVEPPAGISAITGEPCC